MKNDAGFTTDTYIDSPTQTDFKMSDEFYSSLERQYKRAINKLQAQSNAVEKCKKAYHKSMFYIERKAIKVKLALTTDDVVGTKKELGDLAKKAAELKEKYLGSIIMWRSKFAVLLELTKEMTRTHAQDEVVNLDHTLSFRQRNNGQPTASTGAADTKTEAGVKIDRVQILREKISTPLFEEYVPSGKKNEMFEAAVEELTNSEDKNDSNSAAKKCENGNRTVFKAIDGVQKLPTQWKPQTCTVIKDYNKQRIDELNLHTGEQVIQVLPADSSGMAFGVKKNGMLRKKKGFFPISHVQVITVSQNNGVIKMGRTKRNASNPVQRILEAITEPKTKISLLEEVASDDGAKVFDDQKKPKKVVCKKKWLRTIYGIDISDDETYTPAQKAPGIQATSMIPSAVDMSPDRCVFSKVIEPLKTKSKKGATKHKELVLEDIESSDGQKAQARSKRVRTEKRNFDFYY